jgi:hypothetical protein
VVTAQKVTERDHGLVIRAAQEPRAEQDNIRVISLLSQVAHVSSAECRLHHRSALVDAAIDKQKVLVEALCFTELGASIPKRENRGFSSNAAKRL